MNPEERMRRVSHRNPCPVCGKLDWCLVAPDGSAAICPRISEGAVKSCGAAGYLHVLRDNPERRSRPRRRTVRLDAPDAKRPDFGKLAAEYAIAADRAGLSDLAGKLGLSIRSLIRLRVGWANRYRGWAFPMCDADMLVQGIRLRSRAGRKWAVRGSKAGLFIPADLDVNGLLWVCEGPTDTAALLDVGLEAVGRPSCLGGRRLLAKLVRRHNPQGVVIVSDRDDHGAGQRGAGALASALLLYAPSVRIIYPPDGIKDVREWKRAGATREDIQAVLDSTTSRVLRSERRSVR